MEGTKLWKWINGKGQILQKLTENYGRVQNKLGPYHWIMTEFRKKRDLVTELWQSSEKSGALSLNENIGQQQEET